MATFHLDRKLELTILLDCFGVLFVTEKCLCAMFGFMPKSVHISKDDAYDDNNNVTTSIYQAHVSNL
jgi:hypothetical protein